MLKALQRIRPEFLHGAVTAGLVLLFSLLLAQMGSPVQRALMDFVQRSTPAPVDQPVVVVAIDEASQAKLGDWPWSAEMQANLLEELRLAGVTAVGFATPLGNFNDDDTVKLEQAILAHGRVVLPLAVSAKTNTGNASRSLMALLQRTQRHFADGTLANAASVHPLETNGNRLLGAAAALGHLSSAADADGITRSEMAAVSLDQQALPSLALALANLAAAPKPAMIVTSDSVQLTADASSTRLTSDLRFLPRLSAHPVTALSAWDVLNNSIVKTELQGKTVVIGVTDGASADRVLTATGSLPRAQWVAQQTRSLLQVTTFARPGWSVFVQVLLALIIIGLSALVFVRLRPLHTLLISLGLVAFMFGLDWYLLAAQSTNLYVGANTLAVLCAAAFHFFVHTDSQPLIAGKAGQNASNAGISMETLKTLALTLHGQGQLDLAYETLRRCEANSDTLDLLYRLAGDYERRRDILKAAQVHRYIVETNADYKDSKHQLERLQQLIDRPKPAPGSPTPLRNITKPKDGNEPQRRVARESLGRYEIEKQIGKGAMGVVYLGRDPKINRVVAIKAIPLAEEFEDQDLAEARERFFREAEMAGRLNHPGIVTIFDAGEDRGLAYIAMEFIQGEHLSYYCEPSRLLPLRKALTLVIRVAEALHYAHLQNVVHRDIKPANIMFNIDTDALKITDFGIARLADVSRTKTGIVLGTPSFMSPEQLEGRPLDGRSDLFSLGVSMYQMLTGQLPFRADSMTRLMNNIATEPHPSIRSIRPDLPECLDQVIDRALAKSADDRFQNGVDMADALRNCMRIMSAKD